MSITSPPFIEVKDVSYAYEGTLVLDGISFQIQAGDYVGIVGPNGGGKTTLLKILVGIYRPHAGNVLIDGVSLQAYPERYRLGYVPQRIAQYDPSFPATVYEIVESGRVAQKGLWRRLDQSDRLAIEVALQVAGIADLSSRPLSSLSGGQRQRVYVARALAGNPRLLVLDEPFVGIDVAAQHDFYAFLKRINEEQKITILFVSHDIDVIADEATSILCVNRGLLCAGKPNLLHEPHVIEDVYGKRMTHIHHDHLR